MRLSIVIPVYNEVQFLPLILNKVVLSLPHVEKEIILVDDCSQDGTRDWIKEKVGDRVRFAWPGEDGVVLIGNQSSIRDTGNFARATIAALYHDKNEGKRAALRTGLRKASGDVIVIQDADLELTRQIGVGSGHYLRKGTPTWSMVVGFPMNLIVVSIIIIL